MAAKKTSDKTGEESGRKTASKSASKKSARGNSRNEQVSRILDIISDLSSSSGMSFQQLADRHGTTTRTIQRDFDAIRGVGIDIEEEERSSSTKKYWTITFNKSLAKLGELLQVKHYLALRVSMGALGRAAQKDDIFEILEDLASKVENAVGKQGRADLDRIEKCFYSYEKFGYQDAPPEVVWALITAIAQKVVCRVTYRSVGKDKDSDFRILPLRMFMHDQALYLHATSLRHGKIIALNLHRLTKLTPTKETAEPPADYWPEDWENNAFRIFLGTVVRKFRLRFESDVAPYILERVWHPEQDIKRLPKGRVELTFSCSDSPEVRGWIAQWRASVEVLEPKEVREEFRELGAFYSGKYGGA